MNNTFNFNEELAINPDALDVEWLMQPQLFMKYAEALADAEVAVDRAKEKLELARAETDSDVRGNIEAYTGSTKKPTEAVISALITQHPDYKDALSKFNEAKSTAKIMVMAVRAFDQRKTALENLVRLHGQSYFSSPSEDRNLKMEFEKSARQSVVRGKVYSKLNPKIY